MRFVPTCNRLCYQKTPLPAKSPATWLFWISRHFSIQTIQHAHQPTIPLYQDLVLPFLHLLKNCKNATQTKEIQAQTIITGLSDNSLLTSKLLQASDLDYAQFIFNQIKNPSTFLWNSMIQVCSKSDSAIVAILLYNRMLSRGTKPNHFTFPSLIGACAHSFIFLEGTQVHCHAYKMGFDSDKFLQSSLIHMYSSFGEMTSAQKLFDEVADRNVVIWTALINGYSKAGDLEKAREVFDGIPEKDVIAWSAMISGYVHEGRYKEGLNVFIEMQVEGVIANESVLVSVLSACAYLDALYLGRWVHLYTERRYGLGLSVNLGTALVDMYAKCGVLSASVKVFQELPCKNILSWNALMGGFAIYGDGQGALGLFSNMLKAGLRPDGVTFLGLLGAFSHGGMVNEGKIYFETMTKFFFVEPMLEHHACMIDLLSRAGLLQEATELVESMPMEPDACIWGALLGGCRVHQNVALGTHIGEKLIELEPDHGGRYVLLSNIYASAGRWDDARKVRELMKERGVKRRSGHSSIEVRGLVHEFVVGDRAHPQTGEIYRKLEEINKRLIEAGYNVDTRNILFDMDEEEKELQLSYHSEKLAIALGLIYAEPKAPIRIVKNLRVCNDCHAWTNFFSKIYGKDIVVRDSKRFHHFKDGVCSCGDYW